MRSAVSRIADVMPSCSCVSGTIEFECLAWRESGGAVGVYELDS